MHYIIEFTSESTQQQREEYLNSLSCEVTKTWDNFSETVMVTSESPLPESPVVSSIVNDEEAIISPLEYPQLLDINRKFGRLDCNAADPDITFSTTDEKDWWKNFIQFSPEFEKSEVTIPRRGHTVPVYILDSGIKHDHSEFENVDIENIWTVTPDDFSDPNGHGTAIASVISGETCGITRSPLKIVKIFRSDRGTFLSEFLDALNTILNHVVNDGAAVINCSWSIPKNELIESKFQKMIDRGFLVVASAGNNGIAIGDVTPASMSGVLAVGSYGPDLVPSDFSNYQDTSEISYTAGTVNSGSLNVWAPGEKIWAAGRAGDFGYTAGTSMSAAIASAIISTLITDFVGEDRRYKLYYRDREISLTGSNKEFDPIVGDKPIVPYVCGKKDLLDLSDDKYATAQNCIVSMMGDFNTLDQLIGGAPTVNHIVSYIRAGEVNYNSDLYNGLVKHFEKVYLLEPLPEFCTVLENGELIITPPAAEPGSGENGEILATHLLKFKGTNDDIEYFDLDVELKVISSDINLSDLPEDHEIAITLESGCNAVPVVVNCGDGAFGACLNNCGSFEDCCRFGFSKLSRCECFAFF